MNRIVQVAIREFVSTAITPGFIIGALVVPLFFVPVVIVIGYLMSQAKPPAEMGVVALIDRSGVITETFAERIAPDAIAERRAEQGKQIAKVASEVVPLANEDQIEAAAAQAAGSVDGVPRLTLETLDPDDAPSIEELIERQKDRLRTPAERDDASRLIAVVLVDPNAVEPRVSLDEALARVEAGDDESEPPFGAFELFQRPGIDARTIDEIRSSLTWSIREKRFERAEVDRDLVAILSDVDAPRSQEVTAEGTRSNSNALQRILPFVVIFLLFMGVLTGGQYLLTTTIEEKSSRVVELLLAAVSPMQLMTGKIFGQLGVGLTLLIVYNAMGLVGLAVFNRMDLIATSTLVFMLIFFLLSYVQIGGFMAAIGSSVTELREAQSLMTPVMLVLVFSFYLSFPVAQDPDAVYAVVLSFIPPASPFVMLTRIASTEPPPLWQSLLAVGINVVAAYVSIWVAAKIFRVGLLMFGKPPNIKTLAKWISMA